MNDHLRLSGKEVVIPLLDNPGNEDLKFEKRPGGITLVLHPDGRRERVASIESSRFFSWHREGKSFFFTKSEKTFGKGADQSGHDLTAQFPGKVRKVLVKVGDLVEEGSPLIVLEAMKMEFSIKAPKKGKVMKIQVKEGESFQPGIRFVELES